MAYRITAACIRCGECAPLCPEDAIFETDNQYRVDPVLCTECIDLHERPQCEAICPVDCCMPDPEYVESREELLAKRKAN